MDRIKEYYGRANIAPQIVEGKIAKFRKHTDIGGEFAYWIENREYKSKDCVSVCGYTAEELSKLSPYLVGEGSFMLLIELRENPDWAKRQIKKGFKIK